MNLNKEGAIPMATTDEKRGKALQDSYSKTTAWLIEQHRDEFNAHRQALLTEQGVVWEPKMTEAQKQEALFADLVTEHPELLDHYLQDRANAEAAASAQASGGMKVDGHS